MAQNWNMGLPCSSLPFIINLRKSAPKNKTGICFSTEPDHTNRTHNF